MQTFLGQPIASFRINLSAIRCRLKLGGHQRRSDYRLSYEQALFLGAGATATHYLDQASQSLITITSTNFTAAAVIDYHF